MWSEVPLVRNSVNPLISLLYNSEFRQWDLQSHCYKKRDRRADMDGPISRSSLMLEREEHLERLINV
jgi:hypothetical protein